MADVAQETNVSEEAEGEVFSDLFFPVLLWSGGFHSVSPHMFGRGCGLWFFLSFSLFFSLSAAALAQLSKDPKFQSILQKHLAASKNSYEKYALKFIIIIILCMCVVVVVDVD